MVLSMFRIAKPPIPALVASTLLLLGAVPAWAGKLAVPEAPPQSAFHLLAGKVARSDSLQRYDFASIALDELIADYEASYRQSAREQHSDRKAQLKLARWRRESRHFIDQLRGQLAGMNPQSHIEIEPDPSGTLILFVDDTPILVSGPEIGKAGQMEQRIVDRFCDLHDCAGYRDGPAPPPKPVARPERGGWLLQHRQGATYATRDGLSFVFRTLDNRAEKQAGCEVIARDLRRLVSGLRDARRAGYTIDWQHLNIATLHDGIIEQVVINGAGDYLNMELDFFGSHRGLEQPFLGWTQKRVEGQAASIIISNADQLIR